MRIAQVVSTYPPYAGGMGAVAAEYTDRLRVRDHDVDVFTPWYEPVENDPDYVHRMRTGLRYGNAACLPSLYRALSDYDIVHLHYPFFGGALPVALARRIKRRWGLVMTYHMDAVADGWKGTVFRAHARTLLPYIARSADALLASSRDYAQTSDLAHVSGALDRLEALPFGIDPERFFPGDESALRARFDIPNDAPVILFVGGMDTAHAFKGVPVLLDTLERITTEGWHAVLVGSGNLRASFEADAARRNYTGTVHFAGYAPSTELPAYYRMANVHVFPSTARAEAFGLVALEAAASGIPSIASDLPGVRTVVQDQKTGLLVPPRQIAPLAEAITHLLTDSATRLKMGNTARTRVEAEFAWSPLMDRLENIYQTAAESL